jgi:hypothetical protein
VSAAAQVSPSRFTVVDSNFGSAFAGPSFRSRRLGPEWDLLERFLNAPPFDVPAGCEAVIFREPRLVSGFPDLVIVIWDKKKTAQWQPARGALTREDVRVAHYVYHKGPCTDEHLIAVFTNSVGKNIDRLDAAGVLKTDGSRWLLRPLTNVFAARQILAVEAKISEWKVGLDQAVLNTWFASASYMERAKALGVGVWTEDHTPVKPERAQRLPRSYASWLFNEWAWRASAGIG